ncbi:hypothetical protein HN011_000438 [Eciton burchellii]|nr:hypothetical protein HN011_000438 [Eciton burchellii]
MADVDSVVYTTTERKVRKVKKTTKRRESHDQNASEVTITELDSTQNNHHAIEDGEYTKAMNKDWHSGHFCCWQCDESLTGQRYVLRDEHPYCIKCYESVFANGCEECNKIIGIDSKDLSYKDKHWHEACFLCNRCRVSLVDKQFGSKVDKIYCGNCYDAQFASRCDGCGEIFRAVDATLRRFDARQIYELQARLVDLGGKAEEPKSRSRGVHGVSPRSLKIHAKGEHDAGDACPDIIRHNWGWRNASLMRLARTAAASYHTVTHVAPARDGESPV